MGFPPCKWMRGTIRGIRLWDDPSAHHKRALTVHPGTREEPGTRTQPGAGPHLVKAV